MAPLLIEILAAAVLLAVSLRPRPALREDRFRLLRRWYPTARRHPSLVFDGIGLVALALSAGLGLITGLPEPSVNDEFSYLLAADTFAQGRMANPPHPLWRHFEAIHILQQPTYASKYPPAQGLALALGQVLFGHPIVGVWLSVALASTAIAWMLAGYVPLRWACLGGLVAVSRLVFSGPARFSWNAASFAYWSQSYWGGAVAALGGALVFGALPRIMRNQRPRDALWLAVGLAILADSRPFEGLVASVPAIAVLAAWTLQGAVSRRRLWGRVVMPVAVVLLATALGMGYYNFRVTGHPLTLPYQAHAAQYAAAPVFLWQPLGAEPHYTHTFLRDFHAGWERDTYLKYQSLSGWAPRALMRLALLWFFFVGPILTPFLLFLPKARRRWPVKFSLAVWLVMIAALLGETWTFPHYAAPVASLAFLLVVEGMRQTRRFTWRGRPVGRSLVRCAWPTLFLAAFASFATTHSLKEPGWVENRSHFLKELERGPARHLVLVRYPPGRSLHNLWHYNGADIDAAKVVWAAELNPEADQELLAYFKGRRVWLLIPDERPPRLLPYPATSAREDPHSGGSQAERP